MKRLPISPDRRVRIDRVVLGRMLLIVASFGATRHASGQPHELHGHDVASDVGQPLDPWSTPVWSAGRQSGSLSCASATCHGRTESADTRGSFRRREYPRWLEHDPHARAAATLVTPEFQRILAVMSSGRPDGAANAETYAQCAACHDPQGLAHYPAVDIPSVNRGLDQGTRGIGCETCHGPAERWLASHYQHGTTRGERIRQGMLDLRNLVTRGRVCAGCHVGDERRDLNHDMLAAGHPPLRFELSAYHDLIRAPHWPESQRLETPDFKVRLWAAGQVAVADSTLGLLASRAERAVASMRSQSPREDGRDEGASRATPWPEFSEYDCFACHQRLRPATEVNRHGARRAAGAPIWQPWNRGLLAPHEDLENMQRLAPDPFARLQRLMERGFALDPTNIRSEALATRSALRHRSWNALGGKGHDPERSSAAEEGITMDSVERLLGRVASLPETPANWTDASQRLLALKAAYLAIRDERQHDRRRTAVRPNIADSHRMAAAPDSLSSTLLRFEELSQALRFGSREFEWPRYDWEGLPEETLQASGKSPQAPHRDLATLGSQLRSLATELRTQVRPPPPRRSEGVRGL